ncbi:MAG: hypothetical protein WDO24_17020 [Pseudomonadota bacterium]
MRLYDLANGKLVERMGLFLHRDLKRWVAWLPEGLFDHSDEGGRELVGYVLNRRRAETPDWISFAQVYRLLYAPDLVRDRLLAKPDIEATITARMTEIGDIRKRFDAVTPPTVELEAVCFERLGSTACTPVDAGQRLTRGAAVASDATPPQTPADPTRAPAAPAMAAMSFTATPQQRYDYALPSGIDQVVLRYKVTDRGGGVGATDFFLNEHNAGRQRGRAAGRRDRQGRHGADRAPARARRRHQPAPGARLRPGQRGLWREPRLPDQDRAADRGRQAVALRAGRRREQLSRPRPAAAAAGARRRRRLRRRGARRRRHAVQEDRGGRAL